MTIDINVTLFVREQRVLASPPSSIDNTNVVTLLSVQECVVAWVRGDNRYQCHLVCMRSVIVSPSLPMDVNATLLYNYVILHTRYPQSPLDIPKWLSNPIPIMGMIQIQIYRTCSTFTDKYLFNILVYRCHYCEHDLNSNQSSYTAGKYIYMQKYVCYIYS